MTALPVGPASQRPAAISPGRMLVPLALAQFIASFAGSNMNVAINSISQDLHTDVHGVQTAITLFLLTMAALMIPGSKLTDNFGRKQCFIAGLCVYGIGAVIASLAPRLVVLIIGYSAFQGVGSALMIPPIYILTTMLYTDVTSRAKAFGIISGMGGVGSAAGPLIGGLLTTAVSWRASFVLQAVVVAVLIVLSLKIVDPLPPDRARPFDVGGAVLSAVGMVLVVMGILQAGRYWALTAILIALGAGVLAVFFLRGRARERRGQEVLLSSSLFRNRVSNLGLITQNVQWLVLLGGSFVVSVFLQVVRGYSAIHTGVIFTSATVGILTTSLLAPRFARRFAQRTLIRAGFVITIAGIGLLLGLNALSDSVWVFVPGLLAIGTGVGVMMTPSVNLVQGSFPEAKQGEISGLSRAVSNLGSSLGTAIAGTVLLVLESSGNHAYAMAMIVLGGIALIGLGAAMLLPPDGARR